MSLTWRGVRRNWLPAHTDALVVIVVAAAGQQEVWTPGWQLAHIVGPGWVNSLGYLLCAAALWWRRRAPLRVLAFIAAVDITQFLTIGASQGLGAFLPMLAGMYALGRYAEPRELAIGDAATGGEAVQLARTLHPDVVLMDIRMPDMDGLAATRAIMCEPGPPRVIVLTIFDTDEFVYQAMKAGASGFLLKDVRRGQLADAIRTAVAGDTLLAPVITRRLIERFCRQPAPGETPGQLASLTSRELQVLRLVGRGQPNTAIASSLFIAETTVKTHVAHILTKLGLADRAQAVVLAYETGLVQPGENNNLPS